MSAVNPVQRRSTYLSCSLVETKIMSELFLAHSSGCVDLVAENEERNLGELLDGKKGVKFGLGLGETFNVNSIDKEDDTVDLREIVTPESTRCAR